MVDTRCRSAGSMPASAARRKYVLPSASRAIVMPPDADPVSDARILVATASETSGPPPIESTQSRTVANAGSAAMTAPNPTRLATPKAGSTEALAPASMLSRNSGSRDQLVTPTTTMALASTVATDHTPPTAAKVVAPQRSSARNDRSSRGHTTTDMTRFTVTTTTSGSIAQTIGGEDSL